MSALLRSSIVGSRAAACGFLLTAGLGLAQDAPSVRTGNTEIGGFVGLSAGADKYRVMGGGNVSYAVKRWLLPYVEYSYFPGIARQLDESTPNIKRIRNYTAPISDFHGGVHLRATIAESRVVPYGVFGIGVLRSRFKGNSLATTDNETVNQLFERTDTDLAVNFGGGLRYYLNDRLGFRLEMKTYRPVSGPFDAFFYKTEIGIFYQVR